VEPPSNTPIVWQIIGVLVVVFIAVSVIGLVLKALRFLLLVGLVIAVAAALLGAAARKKP